MAGRQERGWRRKGMELEVGEGVWGGRDRWRCRGRRNPTCLLYLLLMLPMFSCLLIIIFSRRGRRTEM